MTVIAQTPTQEQERPFIQDYVKAVIGAPPASLGVDPFYKKYTDALGSRDPQLRKGPGRGAAGCA